MRIMMCLLLSMAFGYIHTGAVFAAKNSDQALGAA